MQSTNLDESSELLSEGPAPQKNPFFTTLVIDSKFSIAASLEDFLRSEGHFILKAGSAEEALGQTRHYQPDLILLDSDLQGMALLQELLIEHAGAAVIILGNNTTIAQAVEAIKWGAVDVLPRPLDLKKLKLAIDTQKDLFKIL